MRIATSLRGDAETPSINVPQRRMVVPRAAGTARSAAGLACAADDRHMHVSSEGQIEPRLGIGKHLPLEREQRGDGSHSIRLKLLARNAV
jgi:hypothetical protein